MHGISNEHILIYEHHKACLNRVLTVTTVHTTTLEDRCLCAPKTTSLPEIEREMSSTATYSATTPIRQPVGVFPQPITALSFDPVSDALWTGTDSGSIVAAYTPAGIHGVRYPVGGGFAVKKIIAGENYVNAIGGAGVGVGSWTKGGMNKWYFRSVRSH